MKIVVSLIIITKDGYALLNKLSKSCPAEVLPPHTKSRQVACNLLEKFTGMKDGEWVIVRQVAFIDEDQDYHPTVLYAVELPERIDLKDHDIDWISISDIVNANTYPEDKKRTLYEIQLACKFAQVNK